LIEAGEKVFVRFGFDAASVERIAEEAGYSRGAFYSNFPDKDSLFLAVLNRRRLETANAVKQIFLRHPDAAQRLRAVRDWYAMQWQQKEWITLRTEFQLRALRNRTVRIRLARLLRQELETYSALVEQYFAEAGTATMHRPETIAIALVAMAQGLGSIALVDADWASRLGFTEAPNLVFNRLVAIPGAEAGATPKRRMNQHG
jgi:AcrR family transcriptional regulator